MAEWDDGCYNPGQGLASELGFTSDLFSGWIWKKGSEIYISFIESRYPGQGNFSRPLDNILGAGYTPVIPTAMGRMEAILMAKGYSHCWEWWDEMGDWCDVWYKRPGEIKWGCC